MQLQDFELDAKIKNLVTQERNLTEEILQHIAEVDRRKLHLKMSYPSLFEYLTREIGYSAAAAQRRIDAARLLQKIPEVSQQIKTGSINFSQISKLQKICRLKKDVVVSKQKDVLKKLEHQGAAHTDLILAREFQIEVQTAEKKRTQEDESVRVELTFLKEEMQWIEKAQQLLSHQTGGSLKATLVQMAKKMVEGQRPKPFTSPAEVKSVTPRLRKEIISRDEVCQYKDEASGKICGSKYFLEVDHVRPRFANGPNTAGNLRALCSAHNKYRYQKGI